MKIENVHVYGFESALRGMRNPLESWKRGDSRFYLHNFLDGAGHVAEYQKLYPSTKIRASEYPIVGPADLKLACKLIKAGGSHRKFLRQICVWWDITIPRYIWQELDTYKVATVRNSCSTMFTLGMRNLAPKDFEGEQVSTVVLDELNHRGAIMREGKRTAEQITAIKRALPEGFLQKATYSFNYETALKMVYDRWNHRMPEWSGPDGIVSVLTSLPYMNIFLEAAGHSSMVQL